MTIQDVCSSGCYIMFNGFILTAGGQIMDSGARRDSSAFQAIRMGARGMLFIDLEP